MPAEHPEEQHRHGAAGAGVLPALIIPCIIPGAAQHLLDFWPCTALETQLAALGASCTAAQQQADIALSSSPFQLHKKIP